MNHESANLSAAGNMIASGDVRTIGKVNVINCLDRAGDLKVVGDMTVTDAYGTRVIPASVSESLSSPQDVDASHETLLDHAGTNIIASGDVRAVSSIDMARNNVAWGYNAATGCSCAGTSEPREPVSRSCVDHGYSEPRENSSRSCVDRGYSEPREPVSRNVANGFQTLFEHPIGPEPAPRAEAAAPATSTAGGESRTSHVRRADPANIHAFVEFMQRIWPSDVIRIRGSAIERAGIRYVPDRGMDRIYVYTATIADLKCEVIINFHIKDEIERSIRENGATTYCEKYVRGVIDQMFTKVDAKSTNLVYEDGHLVSRTIIDGERCSIETWSARCSCGTPHPESSTEITGTLRRVMIFAPPEMLSTHAGVREAGELLLSDYSYTCADRFMSEASWIKDGTCIDYGATETLKDTYHLGALEESIRKYTSKGHPKSRMIVYNK